MKLRIRRESLFLLTALGLTVGCSVGSPSEGELTEGFTDDETLSSGDESSSAPSLSVADLGLKAGLGGAPSDLPTGEYVDPRDGEEYTWVQHGNLQWMQQNMRYLGTTGEPETQWVSGNDNLSDRALLAVKNEETEGYTLVEVEDFDAVLCGLEICYDEGEANLVGMLERAVFEGAGDPSADSLELAKQTEGYKRYGVAYSQTSALYDVCNSADGWRLPTVELANEGEKLGGEMAGLLESLSARSGGLGATSSERWTVTNEYVGTGLLLRSTEWNGYPTDEELTLFHGGEGVGEQPSGAPFGLDLALLDLKAGPPLTLVSRRPLTLGVRNERAGDSLPLALQSSTLEEIAEFSAATGFYQFMTEVETLSEGSLWLRPSAQWEDLEDGEEFPADNVTLTRGTYHPGAPRNGHAKYVRCVREVN